MIKDLMKSLADSKLLIIEKIIYNIKLRIILKYYFIFINHFQLGLIE